MKAVFVGIQASFALLALSVVATLCRDARAESTEVDFPTIASEYAIDPTSGNIAAVDPKENKVVLYGSKFAKGEKPKPLASLVVGNGPGSIVFKQAGPTRLFAVGCLAESNVYLFDADTLKQLAKIPVTGSDITSVAASLNANDPYVYYCYGRGHDSATGRVHVLKHVDEGLAFDDSMDCAISASGNYAYRRGPWSPSGFESLRKVEPAASGGKATFARVFYDHNSTAQYIPDPFDQYTAAGQKLYNVRLDKSVAQLTFSPIRFFSDRPMVIGFSQYVGSQRHMSSSRTSGSVKLVVASTNSFQNVAELELPEFFTKTPEEQANLARSPGHADFKYVGNRTGVFTDSARNRLVLLRDKRGLIVPYADLKLPDEPFLMVETDPQANLFVGKKGTYPLKKKDPKTKLELVDQLDGIALTAAGLEWAPNEDQVGVQSIRIRMSHGQLERIQTIDVPVGRPSLALPVNVSRLQASDDGKSIVGWTTPNMNHPMHEREAAPGANVPRCILVDVTTGKVLANAGLPFTAGAVAVDDHFVYAVQQGTAVVSALGRNDLGSRKQISLEGVALWLQPRNNKELVVGLADGRWIKYSVPDWKLIAENVTALNPNARMDEMRGIHSNGRADAMTRVADGWSMPGGNVYDATLSKPILIRSVGTLHAIGSAAANEQQNQMINRMNQRTLHVGSTMRRAGGGEQVIVGTIRLGNTSNTLALGRSVETVQVPGATHTSRTTETWTLFIPSADGAAGPSKSVVLAKLIDVPQGQENIHFGGPQGALTIAGDFVYCAVRSRLYQVPLAELTSSPADAAKPPKFKQTQSSLVVDLAAKTVLKHEVVDGTSPYQYALTSHYAGTEIDPSNGSVTIDGLKFQAKLLDEVCATTASSMRHGQGPRFESSDAVDEYLRHAANTYSQLTGEKPKGVPVAFHIGVQATDSTPRTASTSYYVLADLPRAAIEERITKLAAEIAKQREAAQQQAMAQGHGGPEDPAAAQDRIRRLEQRIQTLEAQLEILTKILQSR